jgi:hypothetical protein
MEGKHYLGDGVYAAFDAATLNVIVTTEDGTRETNRIVFEPEVLDALGRFTTRAIAERERPAAATPAASITVVESERPTIYPCGCSRLKVAAGLCSIYDADGSERSE